MGQNAVRNLIVVTIAVVFTIGAGAAWFRYQSLQPPEELTAVTVSPKWLNQTQFAGFFVAEETGEYERQGLDVTIDEFNFEKSTIDDLLNGETDFIITSAEELLLHVDEGKPVQAVAAIYQTSPYALASLEEKDISSPADFAGKKLGTKGGKIEEELSYLLLLESVGLTRDDATITSVGFDKREIDDLVDDDVDVIDLYRTDQLYFFDKEGIEYDVILPEQFGTSTYNDIIVTTTEKIEQEPQVVDSFVKATVAGWERALANRDEAVVQTLRYVTSEDYNDPEYLRFILDQSAPLIERTGVSIGSMTMPQWNGLEDHMRSNGFLQSDFDVDSVYTTDFLQ